MNPRAVRAVATLLVLAAAGTCVGLGFWQLGRASEKRTAHAAVMARLEKPPIEAADGVVTLIPSRRVRLRGTWDRERHILLSGRTHLGAAGVQLVTPLVLPSGVRVLVERGWLAADDSRIAHPEHWADSSAVVEGVAERYPVSRRAVPWAELASERAGTTLWSARALDEGQVLAHVPAPVANAYVRAVTAPGDTAAERPGLLALPWAPPASGELVHVAYAVQWFAFAAIIVAGAVALARRRPAAAPR